MPAPLDPERRARIENDIRDGTLSRNKIATKHNVSGATVSKIGKHLEAKGEQVWCDRAQTKRATEVRAESNSARREELREKLLEDAHRLREQLWEPCTIHHFGGKDNTHNSIRLDQPTFADQRQIMTSVGIAVDKIVRLDGGGEAEKQAASLIEALVGDIRSRRGGKPEAAL